MRIFKPLLRWEAKQPDTPNANPTEEEKESGLFSHAILDRNGIIVEVSKEFSKLTGVRRLSLKSNHIKQVLTNHSTQVVQTLLNKISQSYPLETTEINLKQKGDKTIPLELILTLYNQHGNRRILAIFKNINPQKKEVADLFAQKEHYRLIAENTAYVQLLIDRNMNCLFASPSCMKLSGYTIEEIKQKNLYTLIHPNDFDQIWEIINTTKLTEKGLFRFRIKHKNGHIIPVECHLKKIINDFGQIDHFIISLHDITTQRNYELQLIKARKEAEKSIKLKNSFLTSITHELRTPLNAIIGFSRIIDQQQSKDNDTNHYIQHIESSGLQLLSLIDNLLYFSKLENNEFHITPHLININEFFRSLAPTIHRDQKKFHKENLEIIGEWDIALNLKTIFTDPDILRKIFINLLDNALKFTREGFVKYGCRPYGIQKFMFFVEDTGIGIPKNYQEVIFEKFRQMDQSITRKYAGSGLGLTVTKKMVEILGGDIWVKSEDGKGASFYFTLPTKIKTDMSVR
ncbi:PAS domain-containing sensor histidine kinase [Marinilabiliaceae bacterium JC017]|nr:PAS domain-containing sensor histidine kinase [Marinilabiliaceae bacterium JC017]